MEDLALYIHIPFCKSKCKYCNFFSKNCSEDFIEKYIKYLLQEIDIKCEYLYKNNCENNKNINNNNLKINVKSLYFGGGTPSLINEKYIELIINKIKNKFNITNNCEITIECNPNSVNEEKLKKYKQLGINRISFGVQSLCNKQLKMIGRVHNKKQALSAIKLASKVGFKSISCDLLLGLPGQSFTNIKYAIYKMTKLGVNHISAYMLICEEGTMLYDEVQENKIKLPSEDRSVDLYNKTYNHLKKLGYSRYEISNFAKPNYECRHNQGYWDLSNYIAFGASAHSFYNKTRFSNPDSFDEYFKIIDSEQIFPNKEELTKEQIIEEYIMLALRTKDGIDLQFLNNLGCDLINSKSDEINELIDNRFIEINSNNLFITENNFGLTNAIILKLI